MDMYDARFEVLTMALLMIQAVWYASLSWVKSLSSFEDQSKQSRMSLLCQVLRIKASSPG